MGAIGSALKILEKISTFIPSRIEKLKNEQTRLIKEKEELLKGACDDKKSNRLIAINARLGIIAGLLTSKASD